MASLSTLPFRYFFQIKLAKPANLSRLVISQDTAIIEGMPAEGETPIKQAKALLDQLTEIVSPTLAQN